MLQLNNKTPFAASCSLFANEQAIDCLYITVKATFSIGASWTLAKEQTKPLESDEYWGEPVVSSIRYPSDVHTGKLATDILMNGSACAKDKRPVTVLDVGLSVDSLQKSVRVFGNRVWRDKGISNPEPFISMPLVYEKAYGGKLLEENIEQQVDDYNPVGVGLQALGNYLNAALPNLENPAELIQHPEDQPAPSCFAALAPNWQPRASYAGTYDDQWQTTRCPWLPHDFDKRFHNCASPDLVYPGFLSGGEEIKISNMHPGGDLHFQLPVVRLSGKVALADRQVQPEFNLETLILEPNQLRLSMVWKAVQPYGKQPKNIRNIEINLVR